MFEFQLINNLLTPLNTRLTNEVSYINKGSIEVANVNYYVIKLPCDLFLSFVHYVYRWR